MSSPQARPSARNRRRQRSTRLTLAAVLVGVAAVVVVGAIASGTPLLVSIAAVLAVVLGAAASRITYSELVTARREAARDRAAQAQAYRDITVERTAENAAFVEEMQSRLELHEGIIVELEDALAAAQQRAGDAARRLAAETRRHKAAEQDSRDSAIRLEQSRAGAEARANAAQMKVAELEQQLDVVRSELETVTAAWQAAEAHKRVI
ncbi:hypothetical protein [Nocardioides sp. SR21]|uniref:hypothetical protein n=1 Tax=Nocardioides sp. SR21 TaxID=2919501 RepID=UPI001FAB18D0|nr:hypothetical protein [Nocardioides sp. SR21]